VDFKVGVGLIKSYNSGALRQGLKANMEAISRYLALHRHEVIWAAVFGIVFAVIFASVFALLFDLLPITSRIRDWVQAYRNRIAAQSAAAARKRIKELESYRDSIAVYLASDKAHYLTTLRSVLAVLLLFGTGGTCLILGRADLVFVEGAGRFSIYPFFRGLFNTIGFACFAVSVIIAALAMRIASLDTQAKISAMIDKINTDIEKLRPKLPGL
jgi:hypothetical protein